MRTSIEDARSDRINRVASEVEELQNAAAVALIVLRRALVEDVTVTPEVIAHQASIVFETQPVEAVRRLDRQAQRLGVSSLV